MKNINHTTLKIGRDTYDIKPGDFILDNGSCYQFGSGDKRALKREGFNEYHYLRLPKKALKKIDLSKLRKVEIPTVKQDVQLIYYYF